MRYPTVEALVALWSPLEPKKFFYPMSCHVFPQTSSSSVGPVANATDVLQPSRLIVLTLSPPTVGRSHVRRQVPPTYTTTREVLVAKGGTVWVRIDW